MEIKLQYTTNCPYCKKTTTKLTDTYVCYNCECTFRYDDTNGLILVKRDKADIFVFVGSLIPIIIFIISIITGYLKDNTLFIGIIFLIYPILITLHDIFHLRYKEFYYIQIYGLFNKSNRQKQDPGRFLAFYLTILINIIGIFLIIWSLFF